MIKAIRAKDFLSWETLDFVLLPGTTLIEGWNNDDETPEGSGKSSILNALCWGLYGSIPKDAKTDDVIREGAKGCEVEIEFTDGLKIFRSRKPNEVYLHYPKSDNKTKGKDAKETQALIEAAFGMSFETFCQSVYFSQNYPNKFITAPEVEKAKILSEIQDLSIFDRARKDAAERLKHSEHAELLVTKDIHVFEQSRNLIDGKITDLVRLRESFTQEKNRKVSQFETMILKLSKELESLIEQSKSSNVEELIKSQEEAATKLEKLNDQKSKLNSDLNNVESQFKLRDKLVLHIKRRKADLEEEKKSIESLKAKIERKKREILELNIQIDQFKIEAHELSAYLENPKDQKCPTCGQDWKGDPKHFDKEIDRANGRLEAAKRQMNEKMRELLEYKDSLEGEASVPENINLELQMLEKELSEMKVTDRYAVEAEIELIESSISILKLTSKRVAEYITKQQGLDHSIMSKHKELERELQALEEEQNKSTQSFDDAVLAAETERDGFLTQLSRLSGELAVTKAQSARLSTLKDGFKSVKSFVFQGLLEEVNRKANRYLTELFEQPVKINFSNMGDEGELSKITAEVTIDGISRGLGLYSGGQARRIQLAVDLALSDIVGSRSGKPLNLLILDEAFKDLSEVSMEKMLKLLETRKGSVLLIEHNSLFKQIVRNSFKVELTDGISRSV